VFFYPTFSPSLISSIINSLYTYHILNELLYRDLLQLERQGNSAITACGNLLVAFEKLTSKSAALSNDVNTLSEFDTTCLDSKKSWSYMSQGLKNEFLYNSIVNPVTQPKGDYDSTIFRYTSFYDTVDNMLEFLTFFNNNCLHITRLNLDKIHSIRSGLDIKIEASDIAAKEWGTLRSIRQFMLIENLRNTVSSFKNEVCFFLFNFFCSLDHLKLFLSLFLIFILLFFSTRG
jgi:hypothetical protein